MRLYCFAVLLSLGPCLFAQNLMQERLWKIDSRKKSIYLKQGIFYSNRPKIQSRLVGIRHSYTAGHERIVFDFSSIDAPRVYGHLASSEQKLYIDFFSSTMRPSLRFPGESKYVKNVNFFPLGPESLSVEIKFKIGISADIFHLSSPGRLVIDLKK